MKATLTFDSPEDDGRFLIAYKSMDWALTVLDINNVLRNLDKHDNELKTADEAVEMIRDNLCEIMADRNINLDMIE